MQVREVEDKHTWESFFAEHRDKTFLQSWNWGEFYKSMGEKVWRMGVYEDGGLVAVALVVKVSAKRGKFLMVQHLVPMRQETFAVLFEEMKKTGKREGAAFIRIAPLWEKNKESEQFFRNLGFRQAPMHANAYEATWKLDITPNEEELLRNMRKTTRYVIRQTLKNEDIRIVQSKNSGDLEMFQALTKEIARRQQFVPFSEKYIENEFDVFAADDTVALFFGMFGEKKVAAALMVFWSGIGFYHQAASLREYAKFSIPYLLQWEVIKEAKRRGCTMYDLWGFVDPKKYPKHPWSGPSLFKMGFGGKAYEYMKTQDYPLHWRYSPVAAFERMRKWRRGL